MHDADVLLDVGMRKWIIATAVKNKWRVSRWYSLDDLVQDGFLVFVRVRNYYPQFQCASPTKAQRRHFMALFKRAYINHITSLSNRRPPQEILGEDNPAFDWTAATGGIDADGPLLAKLGEAPQEIIDLVALLVSDGSEYLRKVIGRRKVRETTNEHIARLLGQTAGADYRKMITDYFRD